MARWQQEPYEVNMEQHDWIYVALNHHQMLCGNTQAATAMQAEVVQDQANAEAVRTNVAREEADIARTAAEAKALAEDAKADLAQALPALQAAIDSLNALNKGGYAFSRPR